MACRYEEEVFQRDGKVEECGCSHCPYKNLKQCKETTMGITIKETWINSTKNYRVGETEYYESFTENVGELFLSLQKEFGRCSSKIYVDLPNEATPCGWVFVKRVKYDDVDQYYLQETWVQVQQSN